jgi:hypothetical protein
MLPQPGPRRSVLFDVDSTVLTVYGWQRGAEVGFTPHKRGRPSSRPLLCVAGRTHDGWAASYHPGHTPVTTVGMPLRRRARLALPTSRPSVRVRADRAFDDHALIEWLEAHTVSSAMVARLTKPLQARVASARDPSAGHAVGVTEFSSQPPRWPGPRRFVVIRRPIPDEPSWPLSLFQMGRFLYPVIVTDVDLTPVPVWPFDNDRAEVELVIRELKEASALGTIPSRPWAVNETSFQLVVFASNLLNWFRRLCVPPRFQSWSRQTLRNPWLLVPAALVRPQGVPTLKLPRSVPHHQAFEDTRRQIDQLSRSRHVSRRIQVNPAGENRPHTVGPPLRQKTKGPSGKPDGPLPWSLFPAEAGQMLRMNWAIMAGSSTAPMTWDRATLVDFFPVNPDSTSSTISSTGIDCPP